MSVRFPGEKYEYATEYVTYMPIDGIAQIIERREVDNWQLVTTLFDLHAGNRLLFRRAVK